MSQAAATVTGPFPTPGPRPTKPQVKVIVRVGDNVHAPTWPDYESGRREARQFAAAERKRLRKAGLLK